MEAQAMAPALHIIQINPAQLIIDVHHEGLRHSHAQDHRP